jgi:hypothetical protein
VLLPCPQIGNLADIISALNEQQEQFRRRMTDISNFMDDYKLPVDMQKRVRMCVQYTFGLEGAEAAEADMEPHPRGREGFQVLEFLPKYLKEEVLCQVNQTIMKVRAVARGASVMCLSAFAVLIRRVRVLCLCACVLCIVALHCCSQKVPMFQDCEEGLMRALLPKLVPDAVAPGDYLIREGDIGREMYLIQHGQLEIIADGRVVSKLSSGGFVGEMAIIFEQKR